MKTEVLGENVAQIIKSSVCTSQKTWSTFVIKTNRLILFRKVIVRYCRNRTKHIKYTAWTKYRDFNVIAGGKYSYHFWVGKGCQSEHYCCRVVCGKYHVIIPTRLSLMLAPACRKSKQMSADMFCNFCHFTVYISYVILHTETNTHAHTHTHTHTHSIDSV